jgi:hypothetical protein
MVVGSYIGGSMANNSYNPLDWNWSSGATWSNMGFGALIGGGATAAAMFAAPAIVGAMGIGAGGAVGGSITGGIGGMIGGFINGAGFTALSGESNLGKIMMGGVNGAAVGGVTGGITGGLFGGINAYKSGNNVWSGETIADGRNAFSFKNTPVVNNQGPALEQLPVNVGNVDVTQPGGYPPNDGFLGDPETKTLQPGDVVDRYGGIKPTSRFLSPEGVSIEQRSLPTNTNLNLYDKYKVMMPFSVKSGQALPWYGQPGLGIQYKTELPISQLVSGGYLK